MSSVLYASRISAPPGMNGSGNADPDQRDRESIEIIRLMRDPGCPTAERRRLREQVVRLNLPLARGLASRYQHRGEMLDDLLQVAALALVKAADGYDPERGHSFTGYAAPTILGELKRHFRDRVWAVHVPRRLQERCLEVTRIRTELTQRLHHAPSAAEIATAMGVTKAEVRATEASASAYRADSLNRPVGGRDDAVERQDLLGCEDGSLETMCSRLTVRAAVDRLSGRERRVIEGYFFGDRTQAQIADELRTSQMSVSRLLSRTVAKLRDRLADQAAPAPRQPQPNSAGVRVRTHRVRPGHLVVAVRGRLDAGGVADMRDALVDLAVTHRPPVLIVDLRHAGDAAATVAGALLDAYRAGGHTGTRLCVVNVPAQLHALLCRAGLHRLFTCRPVRPTAPLSVLSPADPVAAATDVPPAEVGRALRSCVRAGTTVRTAASRARADRRRLSTGSPWRPATTRHRRHGVGRNAGRNGLSGHLPGVATRHVHFQQSPITQRSHLISPGRLPLSFRMHRRGGARSRQASSAAASAAALPEVVARVEPSVVTVLVGKGLGSGVVFRDGGLVLTNQHVVGDARTVQLALADGSRVDARVVGTDVVTDLAVLRAERTDLPVAKFRTELPLPGETVLAMGSLLGLMNTVTAGIISGVGREIPGSATQSRALVDLLQTDAPISPGNSGGALVDASGRVVGINDPCLPPLTGAVSIGFAIPSAAALDVADDLLDDGRVTHPYLGVAVDRLTPQIAQALNTGTDRGVLVRDVVAGDPAAKAGLRPGDVITAFGGERVPTVESFLGALRGVEPGDSVELTLLRNGTQQTAELAVGAAEQ